MMPRVRPSALPRAFACPSSLVEVESSLDRSSYEAHLGTAIHTMAAAHVMGRPYSVPQQAGEYDLDAKEVDFLMRAVTMLWKTVQRHFQEPRAELRLESVVLQGGTADVVHHDGVTAAVHDWKTGWAERDYRHQLMGYAWLVYENLGMPEDGRIQTSIGWCRSLTVEAHSVDEAELLAWRDDYLALEKAIGVVYNPGTACTFCPRRFSCEAHAEALSTTITALTVPGVTAPVTRAQLGALYPKVRLIKGALDLYDEMLRAAVKSSPGGELDTGDGNVLCFTEQRRLEVEASTAWPLLKEMGFTADDLWAILKVNVTELKEVVKSKAVRGNKGTAVTAAVDALKAAGAATETIQQRLTYKRKE